MFLETMQLRNNLSELSEALFCLSSKLSSQNISILWIRSSSENVRRNNLKISVLSFCLMQFQNINQSIPFIVIPNCNLFISVMDRNRQALNDTTPERKDPERCHLRHFRTEPICQLPIYVCILQRVKGKNTILNNQLKCCSMMEG